MLFLDRNWIFIGTEQKKNDFSEVYITLMKI